MGQYHLTVNLDKKEFIDPFQLGDGRKLLEQCGWSPGGTNDALHILLAASNGRGGGDAQSGFPFIGRWAGDRIAVVGDYAKRGDLADEHEAETIYGRCGDGDYSDITGDLLPVLEREYEIVYCREEYFVRRVQLYKAFDGWVTSSGVGDRVATIFGLRYSLAALLKHARKTITRDTELPIAAPDEALVDYLDQQIGTS